MCDTSELGRQDCRSSRPGALSLTVYVSAADILCLSGQVHRGDKCWGGCGGILDLAQKEVTSVGHVLLLKGTVLPERRFR